LLETEAVIAIETAAAISRMSSVMGKISIFVPYQAIFMPTSGILSMFRNKPTSPRKAPVPLPYQVKLAPT
jgi:hypothetical protein